MARRTTAARRYAEAAFQMGRAEGSLDAWERNLAVLRAALEDRQLRAVVQHPAIAFAAKERVLRAVMGASIDEEPLNLALLMIRRGRPGAIDTMVEHFNTLLRTERGVSRADVRSALPLDAPQREAILARLRQITGTEVELREQVDERLLGGIAVRIGDTLYDASVRSRLERLRARLTAV